MQLVTCMTEHKRTSERAFEFDCHLIDEFRIRPVTDEAERISPNRAARIEVLRRECDEIVSILVASLRTAKANAQQRAQARKHRF